MVSSSVGGAARVTRAAIRERAGAVRDAEVAAPAPGPTRPGRIISEASERARVRMALTSVAGARLATRLAARPGNVTCSTVYEFSQSGLDLQPVVALVKST